MDPATLTNDLATALHAHMGSGDPTPEDVDDLAEFTVSWLDDRHALNPATTPPTLFLLTDDWHGQLRRHGLYGSLTAAKIAARVVIANRARAPRTGDDWAVTADEDGNRCHRWGPVHLGAPVGLFTIHEMTVS